ncbi:GNAT family N-acetyltransferase [bacterium]|nr:GNAT family N-acetyltransferase [bacterium]
MIHYKEFIPVEEKELEIIEKMENEIFKNFGHPLRVRKRSEGRKNLLAQIAYKDQTPVAFKLGYEHSDEVFYSWLGGVLPEHHGQGIATELLHLQHQKIKELGYKIVRTHSRNQFKPMMILNLKNGFRIVGTQYRDQENDIAIIFEKTL